MQISVSRSVPPKRVVVLPGNTIVYGGKTYTDGDVIVIGEGVTADQLSFGGHVLIEEHDATEEWNGPVGDRVRADALAAIDAAHSPGTTRTHDHGFARYESNSE